MAQTSSVKVDAAAIRRNKIRTYFSKPHNVILVLMGIVLTFSTFAPIIAIVQDTFRIHPGTIDAHLTGQTSGYTLVNYIDLFTSKLAKTNLWTPLINTVWLAVGTCIVSILFGGIMAFLVTRTNLAWKQYLSSIFIFPSAPPTDSWLPPPASACRSGGAKASSRRCWCWACTTPPSPTS